MTNRLLTLLALALVASPAGVQAGAWRCTNDLEVQCRDGVCQAVTEPDAFTPLALQFDAEGRFSLCAYTGCWEGTASVASREPFLVIGKAGADWSDPSRRVEGREDVLIAFHPRDGLAIVKVGGFATPLHCSARGP